MRFVKIRHYTEVPPENVAEKGAERAKIRWLITKDMGAEHFAMRLFEIEPGGCTPLHSHPWEHEVFILEGEGYVIGSNEKLAFKPGDAIFIPPNEVHQFLNPSSKTVRLLCLIPYI
ncbi:MAG: cupin domain-containing protein [Candidatus Bathyarchaeia archaeon]